MKQSPWDEQIAYTLRKERSEVPEAVHQSIERLLANLPERKTFSRRSRLKPTIAAAVILIVVSTIVYASPNSYAEALRNKLQSIFQQSGDPSLNPAEGNQEMAILKEITDQNYTIRIHEVMFDGLRLSFSYSVTHPDGISSQFWVAPQFQLDEALKKEVPGIIGTDSGSTQGGEKVGIVNYYFTGSSPDQLTLKLHVDGIAIFDDPSRQNTIPGNWDFELPVESNKVSSKDLASDLPLLISKDEVQFELKSVRLAARSAMWQFRWEFPEVLLPNPFEKNAPIYGIVYEISAGGKKLNVVSDLSRNSGRLTKDGQVVKGRHFSTSLLVTGPLPEGTTEVTITPVWRVMNKGASEYVDTLLTSYKITVPIE
ncbi:MAG: DUF4179 domain-containing protein [Candidatus Pristimantibacillus sp.]